MTLSTHSLPKKPDPPKNTSTSTHPRPTPGLPRKPQKPPTPIPQTAALPSPVPSTDSHPSPVISHLQTAGSPATAPPATPLAENLSGPSETTATTSNVGNGTSGTNETVSGPNQPDTSQLRAPPVTTIADPTPEWRIDTLPHPVQPLNGTSLPVTDSAPMVQLNPQSIPTQITWDLWRKQCGALRECPSAHKTPIAEPRICLLEDACNHQDLLYLVLHQLYCRHSLGFNILTEIPELNTPDCVKGLNTVESLLENNKFLHREMLLRFARTPLNATEMKSCLWYKSMIDELVKCLPLLGNRFLDVNTPIYQKVSNRGFPPLVQEIRQEFQIQSPVFMTVIFASMCRNLYGSCNNASEIQVKLNHLFKRDLDLDQRGMPKESLYQLIDEYRKIPMQGGPGQIPLPSTLTVPSQIPQSPQLRQLTHAMSNSLLNQASAPRSNIRRHPSLPSNLVTTNGARRPSNPPTPQSATVPSPQSAQMSRAVPALQTAPTQRHMQLQPHFVPVPYGPIPYQFPSQQVQQIQESQQEAQARATNLVEAQRSQTQAWLMNANGQLSPTSGHSQLQAIPPRQPVQPVYAAWQQANRQYAPQHVTYVPSPTGPVPIYHPQTNVQQNPQNPSRPNLFATATSFHPTLSASASSFHPQSQVALQNSQAHMMTRPAGSPRQLPSPQTPQTQLARPLPSQPHLPPSQPLLPPSGYQIPQTVAPNPMFFGLHQVNLRDPMKKCVKVDPAGQSVETELYHYLNEFAMEPTIVEQGEYNYSWDFFVSLEDMKRRSRPTNSTGKGGTLNTVNYQSGCRTYRLRCIEVPVSEVAKAIDRWSTSSTKWPSVFYIHVNNGELTPRRKAHNGKDLPVDITSCLKAGENKLKIDLLLGPEECDKIRYFFAVEVMTTSGFQLVRSLVKAVPAEVGRQGLQQRLNEGTGDDELAVVTDSLTISLVDPFTARIFRTPARSIFCSHPECFDLETFIKTQKSVSGPGPMNDKWRCPICKMDARPQLLVLDRFFEEIRAELVRTGQVNAADAIDIFRDGSWKLRGVSNHSPKLTSRSTLPLKRKAPPSQNSAESPTSRPKIEPSATPTAAPQQERIVIEID
ncbi:uncharacterized protein N7483_000600 [Penicillium malachiteum]|uniref:uncharacterized protein n=1 Tax=Penicillium malachiteum TaxID=1324776 RepID=UPI002546C237|nr:uncharacterized protein N7483_000600 [Penicillium malachiteum]KAJ5735475.1 hypothetical protein N7483_000600 [Penicillium malachiteum]